MAQECGHWGQLVSLAGIIGRAGRGRQIETTLHVVANARTILTSNPNRISVIIQNTGDEALYLGLGQDPSASTGLILQIGESLQIDQNFPWIGDVRAYCAVSCNCITVEVSIP